VEAGSVVLLANQHTAPGYIAQHLVQVPSYILLFVYIYVLFLLHYSEPLSSSGCIYFRILELLKQISIYYALVHLGELPRIEQTGFLLHLLFSHNKLQPELGVYNLVIKDKVNTTEMSCSYIWVSVTGVEFF